MGNINEKLLNASRNGHFEIVKELLNRNANIEAKDKDGHTPLICASANGHIEIVKELLYRNANIEAKDIVIGWTPLIHASWNGHIEIVKELLNRNANIEAKDECGYTPLMWASSNGHNDVVELLLKNKALINCVDYINGQNALHLASKYGHYKVLKLLINALVDLDVKDNDGFTALHIATKEGNFDAVKLLLDNKADHTCRTKNGKTVIDLALEFGHHNLVRFLNESLNDVITSKELEKTINSLNDVPIELIRSDNNNIVVNQVALNRLKDIKGQISIISIMGPYRTGKSSLMNFLSSSEENVRERFPISSSTKPCTKGVLMFISIKENNEAIIFLDTEGLSSISSSKNWDNKIFLFNLLSCSLFIYYTSGVIKIEQLEDISKMTEMSTKMIKNKNHEHDNPEYLWILRDFDFEENDPKAYFEDQIKGYKQFDYFKNRLCSVLPIWNKMDDNYKKELKKLKDFILGSLLRKKSLNNTFMNGSQVAEFFSQIVKQLNEISVINYADLDITFHNTAKDNLRDIKSKFKTKLNFLKKDEVSRGYDELKETNREKLPMNWDTFNQFVEKLKRECLDELKSKLKQDHEFQKEYVEEYSRFADDQILILRGKNKEKLEKLHRGILNDLIDQFIKEFDQNLHQYDDSKLEIKLVEIENNYKLKGIESIEMEKVYKEHFLHYCETVKMVLEKTWIQEALHSFCKTLMSQFPLEKSEFTKESEKAKNHEIKKLREKVKNDDTFHKLKQILEKQLEDEFNQIKSFNIIPAPQTNSNETYDIFCHIHTK